MDKKRQRLEQKIEKYEKKQLYFAQRDFFDKKTFTGDASVISIISFVIFSLLGIIHWGFFVAGGISFLSAITGLLDIAGVWDKCAYSIYKHKLNKAEKQLKALNNTQEHAYVSKVESDSIINSLKNNTSSTQKSKNAGLIKRKLEENASISEENNNESSIEL